MDSRLGIAPVVIASGYESTPNLLKEGTVNMENRPPGEFYTVTIAVPKHEEDHARTALKDSLQQFFAEYPDVELDRMDDQGTFPLDPVLTSIIVSFFVNIASNEFHSPKWTPALRQYLRSRFGEGVHVTGTDREIEEEVG